MGIKHFFSWFRKNFSENITTIKNGNTVQFPIDNLMIDLNGIFHQATAQVYEYGIYKKAPSLLRPPRQIHPNTLQRRVFERVCAEIDRIQRIVNPVKRILLCIDGVAPQSKQNQQRSRRFRSAGEKSDEEFQKFDSNCITPGTRFMDNLGKYIDWHIRNRIGREWGSIEIIFSNEKVAGEGEHKLINYMRKNHNNEESYLVHGMDADLIMLTLGTGLEKMYIMRDVYPGKSLDQYLIDIGKTRENLAELLRWGSANDTQRLLYDFIFMCFTAGNDFLPKIQSVEIMQNGIDTLIEIYKFIGEKNGYLTELKEGDVVFSQKNVHKFFEILADKEIEILNYKANHGEGYFPDYLILKHLKITDKGNILDFKKYETEYGLTKFGGNVKGACNHYLEGMQWVLSYYIKGVPNWNWYYDNHYAPLATHIKDYVINYTHKKYEPTRPVHAFQQLMSVLPPKSCEILPSPLNKVFEKDTFKKYSPEEFEIDLTGTKREWEGIVIIPFMPPDLIKAELSLNLKNVDEKELKRAIPGKNMRYKIGEEREFQNFYGNIRTFAIVELIE